jgi:DNA-binding beta-propeller fold protein YncE
MEDGNSSFFILRSSFFIFWKRVQWQVPKDQKKNFNQGSPMKHLFLHGICVTLIFAAGARADQLVLVAGGGTGTDHVPATQAKLNGPFGVDFDKSGNMYIVEMTGNRVLRADPKGTLTIIAGTGAKGDSGDGGPATMATFNGMHSLAVSPDGLLYLADTWNGRIRKLDPRTGIVTPFAGSGKKGYGGEGGPALKADFSGIYSLAFGAAGSKLYLADLENRRVRVIDMKTGNVDLVAGNGKKGIHEDGADAKNAPLVDPRAATVDRKGNVYILERSGHALRVVDPQGKIRTVAGTGKAGLSLGDGDPLKAQLNGPKHLCVDLDDNVIIADSANHRVLKYSPTEKKITLVAGTGKKGDSGSGGPALTTPMNEPHGVFVHPSGTLYIVDSMNNRVFRLER